MPRAKKKPLAEPQAEQPPWEEPVDLPFAPPEWAASNRERRLVKDLRPWPRNPRRHSDAQIAQLARSLQEFGQTKPILIDDKDVILAGHGTVEACRKAGIEELEVVVARGWPQAKKRAYVIADNQLAITADWDKTALHLELIDLDLAKFDLDLLGFDPEELGKLLAGPQPPDGFREFGENVPTEHCCPRCQYRWSGNAMAGGEKASAE